jgi:hypothetical protein
MALWCVLVSESEPEGRTFARTVYLFRGFVLIRKLVDPVTPPKHALLMIVAGQHQQVGLRS